MTTSPNEFVSAARAIAAWPAVADALDEAREACTRLRWHQALRRRIPEAAAESRVRGAAASGELEGARMSVEIVRELMTGASTWHADLDPVERVMKGVIAATAATEELHPNVGTSPVQVVARLHLLAAADLASPDELGRPRRSGEDCRELLEVSPAPSAEEARHRLDGVMAVLRALPEIPVPVAAAIVHAEVMQARPFTRANGVVARALERIVVRAGGLDPTGVAVTEAGHSGPSYLGSLTAYAQGGRAGVELWVTSSIRGLAKAASEGERVADAVLSGRLT